MEKVIGKKLKMSIVNSIDNMYTTTERKERLLQIIELYIDGYSPYEICEKLRITEHNYTFSLHNIECALDEGTLNAINELHKNRTRSLIYIDRMVEKKINCFILEDEIKVQILSFNLPLRKKYDCMRTIKLYMDGLSFTQIGEVIGKSRTTVSNNFNLMSSMLDENTVIGIKRKRDNKLYHRQIKSFQRLYNKYEQMILA